MCYEDSSGVIDVVTRAAHRGARRAIEVELTVDYLISL